MMYNIVNGGGGGGGDQLRGSDHRLAIPLQRTIYCKRSLTFSGAVLWNGLPLGLRQSSSLDLFKSGLKRSCF